MDYIPGECVALVSQIVARNIYHIILTAFLV